MDRVERMHWYLLVERLWDDKLPGLASSPIPKNLHGQERIDFHKARTAAKRQIETLFPPDEESVHGK